MAERRRVAVVTSRRQVSLTLAEQVNQVLGQWVQAVPLSLEEGLPAADCDLVLSATPALTNQLGHWLQPGTPVITVVRTIRRTGWEQVMLLPPRTRALVVNDERDTAVETAALFHELGASHLELYPVYPGLEVVPHLPLAITPGEAHLVPEWVRHVVDVGDRAIDPSTYLDVLAILGCFNAASHRRVSDYGETVLARPGMRHSLQWLAATKGQLEAVLDAVQEGIVACDGNGQVALVNQSAETMLGKEAWQLVGQPVEGILEALGFRGGGPPPADGVARLGARQVVVRSVACHPAVGGTVITLRDVTEIQDLERKLRQELSLRGHVARYTFADIVGRSAAMRSAVERARKFTGGSASVLILGESGTGKELFAQAIHNDSPRARYPFVAINCAAVPESLLESELFGYEEGSFTGARRGGKEGLFEQAHMGTIFLDEVADLSPHLQARLLRVLQEREVMRIGATRVRPVNVRVVSATNRDLGACVAAGQFRADLYYRLNVLTLHVPPLRERREDIPELCQHFLRQVSPRPRLTPAVLAALLAHPWPGNVRELQNCMEFLAHVAGAEATLADLPPEIQRGARAAPVTPPSPVPAEWLQVLRALARAEAGRGAAGRRSLARSLDPELSLTEGQLRTRIGRLAELGLVEVRRGRRGVRLTAAGWGLVQDGPPAPPGMGEREAKG